MSDAHIQVRGLCRSFDGTEVLRGIDLDIATTKTTALLGGSGAGKSVFLKHLVGLLSPDSGSIRILGKEIVGKSERELRDIRERIGVLFQDGALFDSMNVVENVAFPLRERGEKNRQVLEGKAKEVLDLVGMGDHLAKMPINLSGGMRKRVALARAVITRPDCILYDEPTAGLDPITASQIDLLIQQLGREFRATSVVVTHDLRSMRAISDHVAVLKDGKVLFRGTPEELDQSQDAYLRRFLS